MRLVLDDVFFEWDDEKNKILKKERHVCFEDVITSLDNNNLLDIIKNPSASREGQYCLIVEIGNYAYVVPFVQKGSTYFLKTIYPSRKQTRKYLEG